MSASLRSGTLSKERGVSRLFIPTAGDLRVDMTLVEAIGNLEEGIEYEEGDDFAGGGDIVATLTGVKTRDNGEADGDAGLKLREKGVGT